MPLVRLLSTALLAAVIAMLAGCGGSPAGAGGGASAPPGQRVQVTLTDFTIDPARAGLHQHAVVFDVVNRGRTPHDLAIRDGAGRILGRTRDLGPGQSTTLSLQLAGGSYTIFCSLPGHESLGMRGMVTVDG